jgi:hydroxyacylglutathione hydrolase
MDFILEQIRVGGDRNFAYLVGDRAAGLAAAVDPSFDPGRLLERAQAQGLRITHILCTHGHGDHTNGNDELRSQTQAPVCLHESSPARHDQGLVDGSTVQVGSLTIEVLHVPGHTPDHLLFHLPAQQVALTGDHLFVGKIGGTATDEDARTEHRSLARTLEVLPDATTIWPGHDYGCRPASTIALEKLCNPFLRTPDLDAFLALKGDWATFKAGHGLM